jgi:serine/threonine-protein kinase
LLDSGDADGLLYYVMPLVTGETLRARLERERQLPIDDAVLIAREVADALGYAHGLGVIHRDIKPENILLQGGHALVADFGIALAVQSAGGARMTQTGLSLGTPQYMSPEQAMGERTIDARSDIYALGAVTYEMLTGDPPFTGSSVQAIVAKVMTERPTPPHAIRDTVPAAVEGAVLTALAKLPADRFATVSEFAAALTAKVPAWRMPGPGVSAAWRYAAIGVGAVALVLAISDLVDGVSRHRVAPQSLMANLLAPSQAPSELGDIALSPDGTQLAFVSTTASDGGHIWLRRLNDGTVRAIDGTAGAREPFWSPDGSAIAFFSAGRLRVAALASGLVRPLAPAPNPAGGAWGPDGTIVYSPVYSHLMRIPATGGTPRDAIRNGAGDLSDHEPSFLPDGRHFLFWRARNGTETAFVGDLASGGTRVVAKNMSTPRYVDPGYLLYFRGSEAAALGEPAPLLAQRFDASRQVLVGDPVELAEVDRPIQMAIVSATRNLLVVREPLEGAAAGARLFWIDVATGRQAPVHGTGPTWTFRISPDGKRVALGGDGLWIYDPARDVAVRIPAAAPYPSPPVWSPDGTRLAVLDGPSILVVTLDGHAAERTIALPDGWSDPIDWSSDGFIYYILEPSEHRPQFQLWRVTADGGRHEHVPTDSGNVTDASISPDGRWVAWESDASGRHEVYLGLTAGDMTPERVSRDGGGSPEWQRTGSKLFFIGGDGRMRVVTVHLGPNPTISAPRTIADSVVQPAPFMDAPFDPTRFAVAPDGTRLLVQLPPDPSRRQLTLLQGWESRVGVSSR